MQVKLSVKNRTISVEDLDRVSAKWRYDQEHVHPWAILANSTAIQHDAKPTDGYDEYFVATTDSVSLHVGRRGTHYSVCAVVFDSGHVGEEQSITNVLGFNDCMGIVLYTLAKGMRRFNFVAASLGRALCKHPAAVALCAQVWRNTQTLRCALSLSLSYALMFCCVPGSRLGSQVLDDGVCFPQHVALSSGPRHQCLQCRQ